MKIINYEYDELFKELKDIHKTKEGETYTARQKTNETPEQFKEIINELMNMDEVIIEIIRLFCMGNRQYKNI